MHPANVEGLKKSGWAWNPVHRVSSFVSRAIHRPPTSDRSSHRYLKDIRL